jgi:hypothetical protein
LLLLLLLVLLLLLLSLDDHPARSSFSDLYSIAIRDRMNSNKTQYPPGCS